MDLQDPGPDQTQVEQLLTAAARVPDHGKLGPWRFICFQEDARQAFGEHLAQRFRELKPEAPTAATDPPTTICTTEGARGPNKARRLRCSL